MKIRLVVTIEGYVAIDNENKVVSRSYISKETAINDLSDCHPNWEFVD